MGRCWRATRRDTSRCCRWCDDNGLLDGATGLFGAAGVSFQPLVSACNPWCQLPTSGVSFQPRETLWAQGRRLLLDSCMGAV